MLGLKRPVPKAIERQSRVKCRDRWYGESVVTGSDRRSADQHAAFCAENTIGDEPARYREQLNGHRVGAIDATGRRPS